MRETVRALAIEILGEVVAATWRRLVGSTVSGPVGLPVDLYQRMRTLEPDALAVLSLLVDRLLAGRSLYGPLDLSANPRVWADEQNEELADYILYRAFELVARRPKK